MNVPFGDADRALVTMVPHTTSARNTTFETAFRTSFLKAGAFDAQGLVTVSASRAIRLLAATGTELWSSGDYGYDGNVTRIGTTPYSYDFFGRLGSFTSDLTRAGSGYVYDRHDDYQS
jgi:hypothetical protein